jgi:hypothetical protein
VVSSSSNRVYHDAQGRSRRRIRFKVMAAGDVAWRDRVLKPIPSADEIVLMGETVLGVH